MYGAHHIGDLNRRPVSASCLVFKTLVSDGNCLVGSIALRFREQPARSSARRR